MSASQGFKEVLEMNDIVKATESSMRILVASIASAADMANLAAQGCDTFTIPPSTGRPFEASAYCSCDLKVLK